MHLEGRAERGPDVRPEVRPVADELLPQRRSRQADLLQPARDRAEARHRPDRHRELPARQGAAERGGEPALPGADRHAGPEDRRDPSPARVCGASTQGTLYLDKPATLVLRFRGGQSEQHVQPQTSWGSAPPVTTLPPNKVTDITLSVPKGTQQWQVGFDWQGAPPAVPALTSVLLKQNGTSTELLY